jgi:hypothetical protein
MDNSFIFANLNQIESNKDITNQIGWGEIVICVPVPAHVYMDADRS